MSVQRFLFSQVLLSSLNYTIEELYFVGSFDNLISLMQSRNTVAEFPLKEFFLLPFPVVQKENLLFN